MARKPTPKPEGTDVHQVSSSGVADPAQTGDSLPQPPVEDQGAAVLPDAALALDLPDPALATPALATPALADPTAMPWENPTSLTVKGPAGGRRRADRQFGPEAVTILARELTGAQIDALLTDPQLVVVVG